MSGGFGSGLKIGKVFDGNVSGHTKPCGHYFAIVSCSCICMPTTGGLLSWSILLSGVWLFLGVTPHDMGCLFVLCSTGVFAAFALVCDLV